MSFNLDIALDEIKRLNILDDLKELLVKVAHEYFGVDLPEDEPAEVEEPEAPAEPVEVPSDHETLDERIEIAAANAPEEVPAETDDGAVAVADEEATASDDETQAETSAPDSEGDPDTSEAHPEGNEGSSGAATDSTDEPADVTDQEGTSGEDNA